MQDSSSVNLITGDDGDGDNGRVMIEELYFFPVSLKCTCWIGGCRCLRHCSHVASTGFYEGTLETIYRNKKSLIYRFLLCQRDQ